MDRRDAVERRKGYRFLEINGEFWQWKRGKSGVVRVYNPDGKGYTIPEAAATISVATLCECCREPDGGEQDVAVPGRVAHYIRHTIIPSEAAA